MEHENKDENVHSYEVGETKVKLMVKRDREGEREKIERQRERERLRERVCVVVDSRSRSMDLVDWKENRLFNTLIMQNLYIVN